MFFVLVASHPELYLQHWHYTTLLLYPPAAVVLHFSVIPYYLV